MRHKANDGVVYAIRAWFKYDTALSVCSGISSYCVLVYPLQECSI